MKTIFKKMPSVLAVLFVALSFASCDNDDLNAPDDWDWNWDENYHKDIARPTCSVTNIPVTCAVWHGKRIEFNEDNKAMLRSEAARECEYPLAITTHACGEVKKAIGNKALEIDMLKVSGPVDRDDITYIKRCVAAGNLRHVDLSAAQLPENTLPSHAFMVYEYPPEEWNVLEPVFLPLFRLDLPEGVTLDYGSLCNVLLTDIDLSKVKVINTDAMKRMVFINDVLDVPSTLQTIYNGAFKEIGDGDLVVNYNFKYVSQNCLAHAHIKAINFSENLELIQDYGLCAIGVKTLELPEGLKTIQEYGISYCKSLETITFPSSLEHIGKNAFVGNEALKSLKVGFADPAVAVGPVTENKFAELLEEFGGALDKIDFAFGQFCEDEPYAKDVVVYVPNAALKAFKDAFNWMLWFETFQGY